MYGEQECARPYKHTVPFTRAELEEIANEKCPAHLQYDIDASNSAMRYFIPTNYIPVYLARDLLVLLEWMTPIRAPDAMYYHHGVIFADFFDHGGFLRIRIEYVSSWDISAKMILDGRLHVITKKQWEESRYDVLFAIDHVKRIDHKQLWTEKHE